MANLQVMARCQHIVELETVRGSCGGDPDATDTPGMFNVHVAGSLIMFHRAHQLGEVRPVQSEQSAWAGQQ